MDLLQINQLLNERFPGAVLEEPKTFIVINKGSFHAVAEFLKTSSLGFSNCHCITAVDRKDKIEVVYHLYSFTHHIMLSLKVILSMDDLNVDSVCDLWKSANWLEREVFDLFGVKFNNHPDLRRILNPEEWTDFPLRKDFARADFIKKPETLGLKGAA